MRPELLQLATALKQTHDPDPACIALIRELLTNGCSPLYNPNLPADDLHATLSVRIPDSLLNPPPDELRDRDAKPHSTRSNVDPRAKYDHSRLALGLRERAHHGSGGAGAVAALSRDAGRTWRRVALRGMTRCEGGRADLISDPYLAYGPDEHVYIDDGE